MWGGVGLGGMQSHFHVQPNYIVSLCCAKSFSCPTQLHSRMRLCCDNYFESNKHNLIKLTKLYQLRWTLWTEVFLRQFIARKTNICVRRFKAKLILSTLFTCFYFVAKINLYSCIYFISKCLTLSSQGGPEALLFIAFKRMHIWHQSLLTFPEY